jgi:hypothetical protein
MNTCHTVLVFQAFISLCQTPVFFPSVSWWNKELNALFEQCCVVFLFKGITLSTVSLRASKCRFSKRIMTFYVIISNNAGAPFVEKSQ